MTADDTPRLWPPNVADGLPGAFVRLGWFGVWLQLIIMAGDVSFMLFILLGADNAGGAIGLHAILVLAALAIMLFTTFWFFRYANLGRGMADAVQFPSYRKVVSTLWTGLWASVIAIVLSLVLLYFEAGRLLAALLSAPQGGAAIAAPNREGTFLTAFDGVSLMGSLIVLTAELALLGMTLWLLFRTTGHTRTNEH